MHYIWLIIIGVIVGFIAKLIIRGTGLNGFIATALIGIVGSLLASLLGHILHWYEPGQRAGFIASIVGAVILLWIYKLVVNACGKGSSGSSGGST